MGRIKNEKNWIKTIKNCHFKLLQFNNKKLLEEGQYNYFLIHCSLTGVIKCTNWSYIIASNYR